jgi:hypothetical protein
VLLVNRLLHVYHCLAFVLSAGGAHQVFSLGLPTILTKGDRRRLQSVVAPTVGRMSPRVSHVCYHNGRTIQKKP